MVSNSSGGGGGRPRIPAGVRVAWAVAAVALSTTFPLAALVVSVVCGWELSWQWVTLYTTGVLGVLGMAFGVPVAINLTRRNGESKSK